VNKLIFDGRKRGQKPQSAVKTLGTLKIKDFSRFLERAKKAKSPIMRFLLMTPRKGIETCN